MKNKILNCLISLAMLFCLQLPVLASYPDVSENHPYYDGIEYVQDQGIMTGFEDGNFHPENPVTRGMIATILYRMAGSPIVIGSAFADVPDWSFYKAPSTWAYLCGIMTGNEHPGSANTFDGEDPVRRQDLALIFYRIETANLESWMVPDLLYNEVSEDHYAYWAMNYALGNSWIDLQNGLFNGEAPATRAVCANLIYHFDHSSLSTPETPVIPTLDTQEFEIQTSDGTETIMGLHDEEISEAIFQETNIQRMENGTNVKELKEDAALSKAAELRAEEAAYSFSHTRPNGSSCFTAVTSGGYRMLGENIAMRSVSTLYEAQQVAELLLDQWMNSPGHRANILESGFNVMGIGSFIKEVSPGHYQVYGVQMFGQK